MQHCAHCGTSLASEDTLCQNCHPMENADPPLHLPIANVIQTTDGKVEPPSFPVTSPTDQTVLHLHNNSPSPSPAAHTSPLRYPHYTQVAVARPTGTPKPLPKGMMIFTLMLTLLLMASGIGLIYYTTAMRPAQLRTQATATVQSAVNAYARATDTALRHSTATAQARSTTIAQAQSQATVQAQSTATAVQNIYSTATNSAPTIQESLASATRSAWNLYDAQDGGGCTFAGGALRASVFAKNYYVPCMAQATNFGNFAMEIEMTIMQGDEGGFIFHAANANNSMYMFSILHTGYYALDLRGKDDKGTALIYQKSSLIKTDPGQTNTLSIVARDGNLYLYINKQFAGSVNDTTYNSGEIGCFAGDHGNDTLVTFKNLRVWGL